MYLTFFDSTYGYNNQVRLGKIYLFNNRYIVRFLLEVNRDLIDKRFWINFFIFKVKKWLQKLFIIKRISPHHILLLSIGYSWRQIFSMIKNNDNIYI
jgi:hypothetical protein